MGGEKGRSKRRGPAWVWGSDEILSIQHNIQKQQFICLTEEENIAMQFLSLQLIWIGENTPPWGHWLNMFFSVKFPFDQFSSTLLPFWDSADVKDPQF